MSFFGSIMKAMKDKALEVRDRKDFLDMVEQKAKPVRRAAYMKQMMKEVVAEGMMKATIDSNAKKPQETKTESDFGIKEGLVDPFKYLKSKEPTKLKKDKK